MSSFARVRMCRMHAATRALVARRHEAHATNGVLSHPSQMCACLSSATISKMSHASSIPVISRSKFDMVPAGFDVDMTLLLMVSGNCILHASGGRGEL